MTAPSSSNAIPTAGGSSSDHEPSGTFIGVPASASLTPISSEPVQGIPVTDQSSFPPGHSYVYSHAGAPYPAVPNGPDPYCPTPMAVPSTWHMEAGLSSITQAEAHTLLQLSRSVKWFSTIDIILCILYSLGLHLTWAWIALVVVIGPISGYKGAREMNAKYVLTYLVFCFLNCGFRIVTTLPPHSTMNVVFAVLFVVVEIYITRIVYRFYRLLKSLNHMEVITLQSYNLPVSGLVYW